MVTSKSVGSSNGSKGFFFILSSDDRKMDHLIQETVNRKMINHIAHRTFTTNVPDQGMLPTGQGVSQKYIYLNKNFICIIFWLFLSLFGGLILMAYFRMA